MQEFTLAKLALRFPTNDACLEEIKRIRYPKGIECRRCKTITKHYKLTGRNAYSCKYCRKQVFPLSGTIFEKSKTPLRLWFFAIYLMTYTWGKIPVIKLQKELGVTYKTAWRISRNIRILMSQNNADLLSESKNVFSWKILDAIEFKVVNKNKFMNENQ
jgi:transposase